MKDKLLFILMRNLQRSAQRRWLRSFVAIALLVLSAAGFAQNYFFHLLGNAVPTAQFSVTEQSYLEANGAWVDWPGALNSWNYRRQIVAVGMSSALTNFPVLVKLNSSRINYANAQALGQDLRFTDNTGALLAHEIESWNPAGDSFVWVKVPTLANYSSRTILWMYYGNSSVADGQNKSGVWDASSVAVWHMDSTALDSTANVNSGTLSGPTAATGIAGSGLNFSGGAQSMRVTDTLFSSRTVGTLEGWFKTTSTDVALFSWSTPAYPATPTSHVPNLYIGNDGKLRGEQWYGSSAGVMSSPSAVNDNSWHHVALVVNSSTSQSLYLDGTLVGSIAGTIGTYSSTAHYIGLMFSSSWPGSAGGWRSMNGILDEFRISNVARSADWINASIRSMNDSLLTVFLEESRASTSALAQITLDQTASQPLSLDYSVSGTSTYGLDHFLAAGTISIPVGQSSGSILALIARDNIAEPEETLVITLSNPVNARLGNKTSHTISIVDESQQAPVAGNDTYTLTSLNALTLNVLANDTDANNDYLTIVSFTNPTYGTISRVGNTLTYTPSGDFAGTDTFTYTITDGRLGTAVGTVNLNYQIPFTWTGAGADTDWTTPANWLGGVVPGPTNTVYFNDQCIPNCTPNITGPISVAGIRLNSVFTGVINQPVATDISSGNNGWIQRGGSFIGSDGNLYSAAGFQLAGGQFTSTSMSFTIAAGDFNISQAAAVFNHNDGQLNMTCGYALTCKVVTQSQALKNLKFAGYYSSFDLSASGISVFGNLEIGDTFGGGYINQPISNGTIDLMGDLKIINSGYKGNALIRLVGNPAGQTIYGLSGKYLPSLTIASGANDVTLNGEINIARNYIVSSVNNLITTGSTLGFGCGYADTCTITPGTFTYNNVTFQGSYSTIDLTGATFNVDGNLSMGDVYSTSYTNQPINNGTILVKGNIAFNNNGNRGTASITALGVSSTLSALKNSPGTLFTINKNSISETVSLTSNALFSASGQSFLLTQGTLDLAGFNLSVNSNLTVASNGKILCNGGTVTAGSATITGEISCGSSLGITWTGLAGDNLWSTPGNWTNNTVPVGTDVAIFNGMCTGVNCNVILDIPISVRGFNILSSYAGGISQTTASTISIGAAGWLQAAGSFSGADSAINISGPYSLSGGNYQSTSNTLTLSGGYSFSITGTGTFLHNEGTLFFTSGTTASQSFTPGTAVFKNVKFGGYNLTTTVAGTVSVNGNLSLDDTYASGGCINSGTINVAGDISASNYGKQGSTWVRVVGATNQSVVGVSTAAIPHFEIASSGGTVTYSGTLLFDRSNYTYTSGTIDPTLAGIIFTSSGTASNTMIPGNFNYADVYFQGSALSTTISGVLNVTNLLKLGDSSTSGTINGGTVNLTGNMSAFSYGKSGTATVKVAGSTSQNISGAATAYIPKFEIASTGGTVTYEGSLLFNKDFLYTSGVVNPASSTVIFNNGTATTSINSGTSTFNNVTFTGSSTSSNFNITGNMIVNGLLTLGCSGVYCYVNTGNIIANGDVVANNYGLVGTAVVKVSGSTNQTITGASPAVFPNVEINSSGGTVTMNGTLIMSRNFTYTAGSVSAGTSTLQFGYSSYYGSSSFTFTAGAVSYNNLSFLGQSINFDLGGGTATVLGNLTFADPSATVGAVNNGSINVYGDVIYSSYGKVGSALINMLGASAAQINIGATASRMSSTFTINKNSGTTVTLAADTAYNSGGQNFSIASGNLNMAGFDLTVGGQLSVASGSTLSCNGGEVFYGTIANSGTINCPGFASYPFYWTGAGGNSNWSNGANWSGGVPPAAADLPIFDATYCGATCDANFDATVNVKGLQIIAGYPGTLTQNSGVNLTVGSKGWVQNAGTFVGSNGLFTSTGSLTINNGSFTATSTSTSVNRNLTIGSGATFNHNNGVYAAVGGGNKIINTNGKSFYDVYILPTSGTVTVSNPWYISRNLTVIDDLAGSSGIFDVQGNLILGANGFDSSSNVATVRLTGSSNQTVSSTTGFLPNVIIASTGGVVTFSGTMSLSGSFTHSSGSVNMAGTSVTLVSSTSATISAPAVNFNNVTFNVVGGGTKTIVGGMNIMGTLTVNDDGASPGTTGQINASGNVVFNSMGFDSSGTAITLNMTGAASSSLTMNGTAVVPNLIVSKTGGAVVNLATAVTFASPKTLNVNAGAGLVMNSFNLTVGGVTTNNGSIARGPSTCGVFTTGSLVGSPATCP